MDFGSYNGNDFSLYTLENDKFILRITDYGATITSFIIKEKQVDVILGFDSVDGYINDVPYMGGSIGRVCNRIAKGEFYLNNIKYNVSINNGPNSLHGGFIGFDKVLWNVEKYDNKLKCTYFSHDGEEGYPGNLNVTVTYTLLDNGFRYEYEGISDKDTLFSMTNHAFFNFNGPGSLSVLDHKLRIYSDYIACVDKDGQTVDKVMCVKNTSFDFSKFKEIGKDIEKNDIQLINGNGYDHHYLVDGDGFRKMVECICNGIHMCVYSDLPGFHLYSGNFLDGHSNGKNGGNFPRRSAVCFETQYYPNAINTQKQIKPILKANSVLKHRSEFIFK